MSNSYANQSTVDPEVTYYNVTDDVDRDGSSLEFAVVNLFNEAKWCNESVVASTKKQCLFAPVSKPIIENS